MNDHQPVPGPYRAVETSIYADQPQPIDHRRYLGFERPELHRGYLIAESIPHKPTRDLLAAAPDLLDACERAEVWISTIPGGEVMRDVLRAAILKAKGRA